MCTTENQPNQLGLSDKNHACACSADSRHGSEVHEATAADVTALVREHFTVQGMTCNHCVASVTDEVSTIDGVQSVSIDLNAGGPSSVMVVSSKPIPVDEMRNAVAEAGYKLVVD